MFDIDGWTGVYVSRGRLQEVIPPTILSRQHRQTSVLSLTDEIHEREISSQLGTDVAFVPHVASWFQGIHQTISILLNRENDVTEYQKHVSVTLRRVEVD